MKTLITTLAIAMFLTTQISAQDWFDEVSVEAGLGDITGFRVWLADVNGDDFPDLLWGGDNGGTKNHIFLYINTENPDKNSDLKRIFVDYTQESGIQKSRIDTIDSRIVDVAALADLDNDGDLDLVTSIYGHRVQNYSSTGDRSEVMLNDGNGNFTLVDNHGLAEFNYADNLDFGQTNTSALSFLDYDLDGNIDLYVGTWFADYTGSSGDIHMGNFLFKGNGDGTFQTGQQLGFAEALYGTNVTDWNNDGWPDIVNSPYCRTSGQFFKNVNGVFVEASAEAGYNTQRLGGDHGQNLCQWEANPADFDNDGDMDLLEVKVHGGYNSGEGRTTISVNTGESTGYRYDWALDKLNRSAPVESHLGDQGGTWIDMDNDGLQDVALGQNSYPQANIFGQERLYLLQQQTDGTFTDVSADMTLFNTMKEAHSMEPADFDLDGDLDLFFSRIVRDTSIVDGEPKVTQGNTIELIENRKGEENNFVQIKLSKNNNVTDANADYIGAKIFVYTQNSTQKQEIQSGLGHFAGMQPFIKTFGLGQQTVLDSIEVIYPNKQQTREVIIAPPVNTFINIGSNTTFADLNTDDSKIISTEDASKLDFGVVSVGNSKPQSLLVRNLSERQNQSLTIDSVRIVGGDEIFTLGSLSFPIELTNYEDNSAIQVSFTPQERLEYNAKMFIYSDADNAPIMVVPITGFGNEDKALLALSNKSIKFKNTWVDSTSSVEITFTNPGELPLEITSVGIVDNSDVFALSDNTPFILQPKESKLITANFMPSQKDTFSTSIAIQSNAYNKDTTSSIELLGICDGPNSKISSDASFIFQFGEVGLNETLDKDITIINTGEGELVVNSFAIVQDGDDYSHNASGLPIRITDEQVFTISFNPHTEGVITGDLIIESDAINEPKFTKRIAGNGVLKSNVEMWVNGRKEYTFNVAPNPIRNNGELIIDAHSNRSNNLSAQLIDATGKVVMSLFDGVIINRTSNVKLDFSDLQSGAYFIKVYSEMESIVVLPVILEK